MNKTIVLDVSKNHIPSFDLINKLRGQALIHFQALLTNIQFVDVHGKEIKIAVEVEGTDIRSNYFFNACAKKDNQGGYKVIIGAGLLARLDALASAINNGSQRLKGAKNSKLVTQDKSLKLNRQKALSDFSFHYMLDLVFWHEVSHIALGHIDYLINVGNAQEYLESSVGALTTQEIKVRRALEADADRQAAIWSTKTYEYSLNTNKFLRYQNKKDAYYDFGYLIGAMFQFFESFHNNQSPEVRFHPKAQERMSVMLEFLKDSLDSIYNSKIGEVLKQSAIAGAVRAFFDILHENKQPLDIVAIYEFLSKMGDELDKLNMQNYQLKISPKSSFDLARVN
jgi:hypothetical protein